MKMSDIITKTILKMIHDSDENSAEIQRNELASLIGCVPSQINYVLSSRFTPEQGYIIESRRGGGGFIRITRVVVDRSSAIMHIINSIGDSIDNLTARMIIENSLDMDLIDENTANIMFAIISSPVIREIPVEKQNTFRASVFKQILMTQI